MPGLTDNGPRNGIMGCSGFTWGAPLKVPLVRVVSLCGTGVVYKGSPV